MVVDMFANYYCLRDSLVSTMGCGIGDAKRFWLLVGLDSGACAVRRRTEDDRVSPCDRQTDSHCHSRLILRATLQKNFLGLLFPIY
eukprot:scaffold10472_cov126-Cylindrotheca_fusiformis.AAC.17